jgi:hypothetical protein
MTRQHDLVGAWIPGPKRALSVPRTPDFLEADFAGVRMKTGWFPYAPSPRSYASWNGHFDEILTYPHMLSLIGSIEGEFISPPVVGKPFKHPTRAQYIII